MKRIFTEYVRSFAGGKAQPDEEEFRRAWAALRSVLVAELRNRGLWTCPPSYLGILEGGTWQENQHDGTMWRQDALEDLLTECYVFVFVTRFGSLQRQLVVKENIDGLVLLSVRNFLFERQKKFDPLGYRIFGLLRSAIRDALKLGKLAVLEGDPAIRNDTVLGFNSTQQLQPVSPKMLDVITEEWNDDLLPDMIAAWGKGQRKVVERLCRRLDLLRERNVHAFRFKDIVDPLKRNARAKWNSILSQEFGYAEGQDSANVRVLDLNRTEPVSDFIERQSFLSLVAAVRKVLSTYQATPTTKRQLGDLLDLLISFAVASDEVAGRTKIPIPRGGERRSSAPSNREIAAMLGISRNRLPRLFEILGQLIDQARSGQSVEGDVISKDESPQDLATQRKTVQ
ncbi:MAG: hypothetical protein GY906_01305 [bacterium]|nr:hypothetical protein [bacterium]